MGKLGRVQLSRYFYMREFLYSEIGVAHGISNMPHNPGLAIRNGSKLAQSILDPLVETFGPIAIRSAYRSPEVNEYGAKNNLGCASNAANFAKHIWDHPDDEGNHGASVSLVIPWFASRYEDGRPWQDLAWWLFDHLEFHEICFFPRRAAFNIGWRDNPSRKIRTYIGGNTVLLAAGATPEKDEAARGTGYADFPPFRALEFPS